MSEKRKKEWRIASVFFTLSIIGSYIVLSPLAHSGVL